MADNVSITAGAGTTIAADDIGGVLHQRVKISHGADGSATDVSSASPLPVTLANTGANAVAVKVDGSAVTQPVSGTVAVSTVNSVAPAFGSGARGATVQRVTIATDDSVPVTGTFWQATQPISGTVTANTGLTQPLTDTELRATPVHVTAPEVADTGNTTTTPLGNGGNFTGTGFDMNAYASWSVNVFADQASATNGFKIQWSDDGTNWDFTDQTTYIASVGNMVTFGRKARYVRVNYTNDTTPQGAFRVTAYAQPLAVRQTRKFVGNQLTDADTGQVVVAALQGHTTAGGGAWVDVKVNPSGALSVNATATDLDIRNLSSATDSVTIVPSGTQAVSGTFWQATQPVSIATNTPVGTVAHDAADSGAPIKVGGRARTSDVTAVASDDRVDAIFDKIGRMLVLPYSLLENLVSGAITTSMTGTTSTSLISAPGAGLYNYITQVTVSNAHATQGTDVALQDGNGGTTFYTIPAAAVYGGAAITFNPPLKQPTSNTALYCANVTTGASTKVSASGFKGA